VTALLKKKQFWLTIVAGLLLAYCVKDVRWEHIVQLSDRLHVGYLLLSVFTSAGFVITKGLRWRLIVRQQVKFQAWRTITLYSAGQILNIVMPALTGQLGRVFLFSKNTGLRKTFVFSTIVMEVLFDAISFLGILLIISVGFAFPEKYRGAGIILGSVIAIVVILLYLILHFRVKIEELGHRMFRERRPSLYIGIKKFIRSFTKGTEMLKSSQHLALTMGYSLLNWTFHALSVYFLLLSFGFDLPFAAAVAVMVVNTIALMVPITPGNAGTFELAVSTALAAFSIPRGDAVLYAVALHLIDLLPVAVLGAIFLHYEKVSLAEIRRQHMDDDVLDKLSEDGVLIEDEEKV